jgi:hypothetical protein
MASRRNFLQTATATAAVAWLMGAAGRAGPAHVLRGAPNRLDFYRVLYDRDHAAASAFGHAAKTAGLRAYGLRTHPSDYDLTALWYDDLSHRWRQSPTPIAGMTSAHGAFCMQMLGQDAGMRMVLRAEHIQTRDGHIEHRLSGPRALLERAALIDAGSAWPQAAAELIRLIPAQPSQRTSLTIRSASASGMREPLVSWVIAALPPVGRG